MTKILFVGLNYHGYTAAIIAEMERAGAEVTFVDIQPRSLAFKTLRTLSRLAYQAFLEKHHARAIALAARTKFDHIVFLQAHQMSLRNLQRLRETQPDAKFTLYNWDSLANHDYRAQAPYFDRVFTFDRADAEAHAFHYLPLFCTREMQDLARDRARPTAVYTVGNIVNTRRYHAVQAFSAYCSSIGVEFRAYLKVSPIVYFRLLREGCFPRGVRFTSIGPEHFRDLVETSTAVFDFANHVQSGQTMRTMENLCLGKKVITNNAWVKREAFFSEDRFHVYEGFDFMGVSGFLSQPLRNPGASFDAYYIQSFVTSLLGESNNVTLVDGA